MAIKNVLGSKGVVSYNVEDAAHMVLSVSDLQDCNGGTIALTVGPVVHRVDDTTGGLGIVGLTTKHVILGNVLYICAPQTGGASVRVNAPPGGAFYGTVVGVGAAYHVLSNSDNLMLICFDDTAGASKWMANVF